MRSGDGTRRRADADEDADDVAVVGVFHDDFVVVVDDFVAGGAAQVLARLTEEASVRSRSIGGGVARDEGDG